jgi:predicted secreted protein
MTALFIGQGEHSPQEMGGPPEIHDLTATDPSAVIEATIGGSFEIVLKANPSTGYQWKLVSMPSGKLLQEGSQEYVRASDTGDIVGTGGHEIWQFSAIGPGSATVVFGYFPPGSYGEGVPEETLSFSISIN